MNLDPITYELAVGCSLREAFAAYTERIGDWWDPRVEFRTRLWRQPSRPRALAVGVRTLMRDVPSIQDKVLAALTARLSDD